MSTALPTDPAPASLKPHYMRAGNDLTSPLTLAIQRLNRLGDRFAFDAIMPAMTRSVGEVWISRLIQSFGTSSTLNYPVPEDLPTTGAPVVNGAGNVGQSLAVRGLTHGIVLTEGRLFSIIHGGVRYLHMTAAQATADGSGHATLAIRPAMRMLPSDGDTVEFDQPVIEGFVGGNADTWTLDTAQTVGLSFTITENQ